MFTEEEITALEERGKFLIELEIKPYLELLEDLSVLRLKETVKSKIIEKLKEEKKSINSELEDRKSLGFMDEMKIRELKERKKSIKKLLKEKKAELKYIKYKINLIEGKFQSDWENRVK